MRNLKILLFFQIFLFMFCGCSQSKDTYTENTVIHSMQQGGYQEGKGEILKSDMSGTIQKAQGSTEETFQYKFQNEGTFWDLVVNHPVYASHETTQKIGNDIELQMKTGNSVVVRTMSGQRINVVMNEEQKVQNNEIDPNEDLSDEENWDNK